MQGAEELLSECHNRQPYGSRTDWKSSLPSLRTAFEALSQCEVSPSTKLGSSNGHSLAHSRGMLRIDSSPALNLGSGAKQTTRPRRDALASLSIWGTWRRSPEH